MCHGLTVPTVVIICATPSILITLFCMASDIYYYNCNLTANLRMIKTLYDESINNLTFNVTFKKLIVGFCPVYLFPCVAKYCRVELRIKLENKKAF